MRWDAIQRFADKKAPRYKNYDLRPDLPVTEPVTPDFDNTTDGIGAITADMIKTLKVDKDELPTNSC